jgi:AmmeMemoRadiSam system protein B
MVQGFLSENQSEAASLPKGMIVPHASYPLSGAIAAKAYSQLTPYANSVKKILLLGTAHHVSFRGLAVSDASCFETPLGKIPVDFDGVERALSLPQVRVSGRAHQAEHSLEVQLPFLQYLLPAGFEITPLVVGDVAAVEVAEVLEDCWGDSETLILVSSNLSHYHDYDTACKLDRETSHWIEKLRWKKLDADRACGFAGIRGLLRVADDHHGTVQTLDVRNSGDTAGQRDEVVGYGAFVLHQ